VIEIQPETTGDKDKTRKTGDKDKLETTDNKNKTISKLHFFLIIMKRKFKK
jgi:hypothetical protein